MFRGAVTCMVEPRKDLHKYILGLHKYILGLHKYIKKYHSFKVFVCYHKNN